MTHWAPPRPQPKPFSRRAVGAIIAGIVALLLLQIAAFGFAAATLAGAVLDVSPAQLPHVFLVSIENDSGALVVVTSCGTDCHSLGYRSPLRPGESFPTAALDTGETRWLLASDRLGQTTGCLKIQYGAKESAAVVPVSGLVPCPAGSPQRVAPYDGCGCSGSRNPIPKATGPEVHGAIVPGIGGAQQVLLRSGKGHSA